MGMGRCGEVNDFGWFLELSLSTATPDCPESSTLWFGVVLNHQLFGCSQQLDDA